MTTQSLFSLALSSNHRKPKINLTIVIINGLDADAQNQAKKECFIISDSAHEPNDNMLNKAINAVKQCKPILP
jgi:hypothetical protein